MSSSIKENNSNQQTKLTLIANIIRKKLSKENFINFLFLANKSTRCLLLNREDKNNEKGCTSKRGDLGYQCNDPVPILPKFQRNGTDSPPFLTNEATSSLCPPLRVADTCKVHVRVHVSRPLFPPLFEGHVIKRVPLALWAATRPCDTYRLEIEDIFYC